MEQPKDQFSSTIWSRRLELDCDSLTVNFWVLSIRSP